MPAAVARAIAANTPAGRPTSAAVSSAHVPVSHSPSTTPAFTRPKKNRIELDEMVPFVLEVMDRIVVGRRREEIQAARFVRQQRHDRQKRQRRMQPDPIERPPACGSAEREVRPERRDFPSAQQQRETDRHEDQQPCRPFAFRAADPAAR